MMPLKNRERRAEYNAEYTQKNKKRKTEYMTEYGARPETKKRRKQYMAEYNARPENKKRNTERNRFLLYNLTPTEYNFMFAGQQHRCALCGAAEPCGNNWHTDHCHETNVVRGILCTVCNHGLGKLGDTQQTLHRAYLYTKGEFTWAQTQANHTNSPTPIDVTAGHSNPWQHTAQAATLYIPLSAGT